MLLVQYASAQHAVSLSVQDEGVILIRAESLDPDVQDVCADAAAHHRRKDEQRVPDRQVQPIVGGIHEEIASGLKLGINPAAGLDAAGPRAPAGHRGDRNAAAAEKVDQLRHPAFVCAGRLLPLVCRRHVRRIARVGLDPLVAEIRQS